MLFPVLANDLTLWVEYDIGVDPFCFANRPITPNENPRVESSSLTTYRFANFEVEYGIGIRRTR